MSQLGSLVKKELKELLTPTSVISVVAVVAVLLLALPQIEYRRDPKAYFLITEDYEAYKEYMASKK